jgi:hypothetical protein
LYFILKLLEPLCDDPKMELSKCVLVGYDVSLKPHHGMIVKGTFSVAVKAAPSRATFMAKLRPDETSTVAEIKKVTPVCAKLLDQINADLMAIHAIKLKVF